MSESTNKSNVESLIEQITTLEDRKGRMVKTLRYGALNTPEAEVQAIIDLQAKYPNIDGSMGMFVLVEESGKRAVYNTCAEKGCNEKLLTRTSDLHQCKFCAAHAPARKGKKGKSGSGDLLKQLAAKLDS